MKPATTSQHRLRALTTCAGALLSLIACAAPASADIVGRETDIGEVRLGQRVYVDDGSCPAGQIKEVTGIRLTPAGVERTRQCVDRKGKR